MMKHYDMPLIEVLMIEAENDIITTSSPDNARSLSLIDEGEGVFWSVAEARQG